MLVFAANAQDTAKVSILKPFNLRQAYAPYDSYKSESLADSIFDKQGVTNLVEAIGRTSPVFLKSYGANGIALVNLRGGKPEHTKLYWNGLDLTYPSLGETDVSLIPLSAISATNITYGPGNASAATAGLGGNVELYQKPTGADVELKIVEQLSSMQNNTARFRFERKIKNNRLVVFGEHGIGQNSFDYVNPTKSGWPVERMRNAEFKNYAAGMMFLHHGEKSVLNVGGWYRSGSRNIPPLNTQEVYYGERFIDDLAVLSSSYVRYLQNGLQIRVLSGFISSLNQYDNPLASIYGLNRNLSWQNQFDIKRAGSKFFHWTAQVRHVLNRAETQSYDGAKATNGISAFLSSDFRITKSLKTVLSVRSEYILESFSGVLPSLVLSYNPVKLKDFYLRYTLNTNVKFPTLNQLYWNPGGNPDLIEERGFMNGLGTVYKIEKGKWEIDVNADAYYGVYQNWIAWMPQGAYWSPVNIKNVITKGVELALTTVYTSGNFVINHTLKTNFNRSQNASSDDPGIQNKLVIYAPEFQGSSLLQLSWKRWYASWFQPVTGRFYISSDNTAYMPMYSYANVTIGRDIRLKSSTLYVMFGVDNVSDWQYQVTPNRPMPGRNYKVSLQYKFRK